MPLSYRVRVEGLLRDGHPTEFFGSSLGIVTKLAEELHLKYPTHEINLFRTEEQQILNWPKEATK